MAAAGEIVLATEITAASTRIVATPVTTSTAGNTSNSTTDVRDAQLGNYVCTTVTGHTYRVWWTGKVSSTVSNDDLVSITVRDGGGSTPTAASTSVASASRFVSELGGPGQETLQVINLWAPTAGTHTLSAFIARSSSGSGTVTPVGFRELYVEDMGIV